MQNDWYCELCGLTVSSQAFMNRHMRQVHSAPNATVQQHVMNFPESCPACDLRLRNPQDLLVHARRLHRFSGTVKRKRFRSYIEFLVRFMGSFRSAPRYICRVSAMEASSGGGGDSFLGEKNREHAAQFVF